MSAYMTGVIQERCKALAPHGVLIWITSNRNGVSDLPGKLFIYLIGVSSDNHSSIYIT